MTKDKTTFFRISKHSGRESRFGMCSFSSFYISSFLQLQTASGAPIPSEPNTHWKVYQGLLEVHFQVPTHTNLRSMRPTIPHKTLTLLTIVFALRFRGTTLGASNTWSSLTVTILSLHHIRRKGRIPLGWAEMSNTQLPKGARSRAGSKGPLDNYART